MCASYSPTKCRYTAAHIPLRSTLVLLAPNKYTCFSFHNIHPHASSTLPKYCILCTWDGSRRSLAFRLRPARQAISSNHLAYVLEFVSHRLSSVIDFRNSLPRALHSLPIISSQLTSPAPRDTLSSLLAIWATNMNPLTCKPFSNLPYRSMRRRRVSHWHNTRSPSNSRIATPSKPLLAFSMTKHDL